MNKDKVYLKGYVLGHAADTLGYYGLLVQLENLDVVEIDKDLVHKEVDEPQLIKLKDIIARIKGFDSGTRKVWLDGILGELGSEYGSLKYKQGYDQGKFEGSLIPYEEPQKPVVSQFVADVIEGAREKSPELEDALHYTRGNGSKEFTEWYKKKSNRDLFARAWLDGYEIEKEKRYRVSLKNGQPLLKAILGKALYFSQDIAIESYKVTRKELEEAGFGWVLDCPGVEVEEVTE